jgi:hypothetical protein
MIYQSVVNQSSLVGFLLLCWLLINNIRPILLDLLLFKHKSVFIPNEVRGLEVESMSLGATLEETNNVSVVWILGEGESSAVVHELSEFLWLVLAEFFNGHLLLLFLDIGVFFLL